jgi:hypothetical protein
MSIHFAGSSIVFKVTTFKSQLTMKNRKEKSHWEPGSLIDLIQRTGINQAG